MQAMEDSFKNTTTKMMFMMNMIQKKFESNLTN